MHSIRSSIQRLLIAGALTCSACSAGAREPIWRGSIRRVGAAVEVRNPAASVFDDRAASAQLLWRTPPASGDAGARDWDRPVRLTLGAGEIYVLDQMAQTVHVLSRSGTPLRRIGRAGKGPGELQAPFGLAFVNGILAVGDGGKGAVELFSPAGEPAGSVALGTVALSLVAVEPGTVLVKTFRGEQRLYELHGNAPPSSLPRLQEGEGPDAACYRVGGAGTHILRLDCTQPVFHVISRDGALLRTVRTERGPVRATRAELATYRHSLASDLARTRAPNTSGTQSLLNRLLSDQNPKRVMRGIRFDPAAKLYAVWEQQPQELGNGPARLHLFSEAGVFLVTVSFPEPWVDFAMDGLDVYALAEDPASGLVSLAAYRVTLTPGVKRLAASPVGPESP